MSVDLIDSKIQHALAEIKEIYGVVASVDKKRRSLLKFGRVNLASSGVKETVWLTGGFEDYQSTNTITKISSSDAGDTEEILVFGSTVDGSGDFANVNQLVTLNGQTPVDLPTPLARINRLRNQGAVDLLGTVYVYQDDTVTSGVPDTQAKIHIQTEPGQNHTMKFGVTMPVDEFWIVTEVYAVVDQRTSAAAEFDFQGRLKGGVFITAFSGAASSDGFDFYTRLTPYLILPPNADGRIIASASSNSVLVETWANGYIAKIIT